MKLTILSAVSLTLWCLNTKFVVCQRTTVQEDTNSVTSGLASFAIELLAKTAIEGGDQLNIIMSTYSIWNLLTILNEGANGATSNQLTAALRLPLNKDVFRVGYKAVGSKLMEETNGVELNTANAIFTDRRKQIQKGYQTLVNQQYKVDVFPVNFQDQIRTAQSIDNYIAKATNNRLKHFINYEDLAGAEILLTTAIFFKGEWTYPFNRSETRRQTFYNENNQPIGTVNLMYQAGPFPYKVFEELQAVAVELPYGTNERYSMIIMLPQDGVKLATVLQRLAKMRFQNVTDALEESKEEFDDEPARVYIPKFKITSDFVLNIVLEKMGIIDVFDPVYADLTSLSSDNLYLSRVIHKAEIEVTEEGTIASAASGGTLSYKMPPPEFIANKPFAYFIIEKTTGTMLFAGKISNPDPDALGTDKI